MKLWFKTRKGTFIMTTAATCADHIRSVPLRRWERKLKVLGIQWSDIVAIYHRNSVYEQTWFYALREDRERGIRNGLMFFTNITPPMPVIQD